MAMWVSSTVNSLRISTIMLGFSNLAVVIVGGVLLFLVFPGCELNRITIPVAMVSLAAAFKIFAMFKSGIAQKATAFSILDSPLDSSAIDSINRLRRRVDSIWMGGKMLLWLRYKTWLWWSRFALVMTLLQISTAIYLVFNVAKYISHDGTSSECQPGTASNGDKWKTKLLISFVIAVCTIPLIHIFVGPAVLRWRSFYQTQDDAWKAHYQEVFDHGIREALCCLGRVKYMRVSKEDEVYSVARLLGDLVAYRASGTGHLELLAGLALLQRHSESPKSHDGLVEAPRETIQEAFAFHEFAEAAYTGPLLDFGRHTVFFPCAWLYRQGILTPWTRNRRPSLSGDNWWRGHVAAFLKYTNLPPEALRRGRVCQFSDSQPNAETSYPKDLSSVTFLGGIPEEKVRFCEPNATLKSFWAPNSMREIEENSAKRKKYITFSHLSRLYNAPISSFCILQSGNVLGILYEEKCEAAYFVVVLRHLRSVVISVRGTETAEDLITDGLGRECLLSREDLDGLIKHVPPPPLSLYPHTHTHMNLCLYGKFPEALCLMQEESFSSHICPDVKRSVESSFPHYGHSGIVEAARDLYMQLEGNLANNESESSSGFLSSLLGAGCECDGYSLHIVGHSLGGAIAALLGLRYTDIMYASVPPEGLIAIQSVHDTSKRDQFLMKLRGESEAIRSNLINREPVPFLDICVGELLREEQRIITQAVLEQKAQNSTPIPVAYTAQRRSKEGHIIKDCSIQKSETTYNVSVGSSNTPSPAIALDIRHISTSFRPPLSSLYRQYPALHVYAYGPLPCVDLVIAEACSEFVTSVVHNNEFSARLSVGSVLRLRAAAIVALAQDSKTDTALIFRLARQFLCVSKNQRGEIEAADPSELHSAASTVDELDHKVWKESDRTNSGGDTDNDNIEDPFYDDISVINSLDDPVSQFLETVPRSENGSAGDRAEMFLPGLVIHMVPQQRHISMPLWKGWRFQERVRNYKAYLANRDVFKDIVVSPSMFFDHLPWRCHNAMKKVLESQNDKGMLDVSQIM
ncbi:hypothetical protein POTOM_048581 [Populus tomentosa]|uniref:DUF7358 domain-containing protein n=1 Tax=Populus tomentosa TaxID=118781 RepID=A0A8X7YGT1_POPTO|nr:hypothetical protein POTOM_048581 [Populus tomentosa]